MLPVMSGAFGYNHAEHAAAESLPPDFWEEFSIKLRHEMSRIMGHA